VHVNRLKKAFNQQIWNQNSTGLARKGKGLYKPIRARQEEPEEIMLSPGPIVAHEPQVGNPRQADSQSFNPPLTMDTPEQNSRNETKHEPPLTRARFQAQQGGSS
jgi:hypothetical protein